MDTYTKQDLIDFCLSFSHRLSLIDALDFARQFLASRDEELTEDEYNRLVEKWNHDNRH